MVIGHYEFKAGLIPSLATLVLLPFLISLGVWQVDRAQQKYALADLYERRMHAAPVILDGTQTKVDAMRFHNVTATGVFDTRHQIYLDNRINQGRAGYDIITPMRISGSSAGVLVNRGWVPLGETRERLPEAPVPAGRIIVHGLANTPPATGLKLGRSVAPDAAWPVLQDIDPAWLEQRIGYPLLPYVVMLDRQDSNGYVREWKLFDLGPERHLGYAFQWFLLALTLVIVYITVNTRRVDEDRRY